MCYLLWQLRYRSCDKIQWLSSRHQLITYYWVVLIHHWQNITVPWAKPAMPFVETAAWISENSCIGDVELYVGKVGYRVDLLICSVRTHACLLRPCCVIHQCTVTDTRCWQDVGINLLISEYAVKCMETHDECHKTDGCPKNSGVFCAVWHVFRGNEIAQLSSDS